MRISSNWPDLVWSRKEETVAGISPVQLPEFQLSRLLLRDFSRSTLDRSSRFHLWINLWSFANNFRVLSLARFVLELGQNRELQKAAIPAENRARTGEDDPRFSRIPFCPPHFLSEKVQFGPSLHGCLQDNVPEFLFASILPRNCIFPFFCTKTKNISKYANSWYFSI